MNPDTTSIAGDMMNCDQVSKGEFAEKYLLGQCSEADQEAYERHFFECAECFQELETCRTLQAELKRNVVAITAEGSKQPVAWHWSWAAVAATVVIAVSVGTWERQRSHRGTSEPSVGVGPQQPASPVPSLTELASVQPPPYVSVMIRGSADEATQRFEQAMRQYAKGNYVASIPGLRAAVKLDPEATDARFYLGISYLLIGQTDQAIEELRRTAAFGDTPYLDAAHFYLAKAYLRKGDFASSEDELRKTVAIHGSHEAEAGKLIEQLQAVHKTEQ
jgi:tetratricopeptide (TPR) repeat protein